MFQKVDYNITYVEAVTQCKLKIEASASGKICKDVISASFSASLDICVEDVQVTEHVYLFHKNIMLFTSAVKIVCYLQVKNLLRSVSFIKLL